MTTTEPDNGGDDVVEGEDNPMTEDELRQAHADAAGVETAEPAPTEEAGEDHDA